MVTFKTIKFKHIRQAMELNRQIEDGSIIEESLFDFVASMVESWDYKDADTGKAIKAGNIDELTIPQANEVMQEFNRAMSGVTVPKETA